MGSSRTHQWETDPLFPAAEVVQDSADRMQSLYLLLLHEKSLVEDDQPDPRLLSSIEHHKRDLATILETAKWQLEDFERAAKVPSTVGKSRRNGDTRHWQFITAIREHINRIERALVEFSSSYPTDSSQWAMDENEGEMLASFLKGETSKEYSNNYEPDKSDLLMRFLDPLSTSGLTEDEIVESTDDRGNHERDMNAGVLDDHNGRKSSSRSSESLYSQKPFIAVNGYTSKDNSSWDLEANELTPNKGKWRTCYNKINSVGFLSKFWRKNRKYVKRMKDGEESWHQEDHGSRPISLQRLCSRFQANSRNMIGRIGTNARRFTSNGQVGSPRMRLLILTVILVLLSLYTIFRTII